MPEGLQAPARVLSILASAAPFASERYGQMGIELAGGARAFGEERQRRPRRGAGFFGVRERDRRRVCHSGAFLGPRCCSPAGDFRVRGR